MKLSKKTIINFSFLFLGIFTLVNAQGVNYVQTSLTNLKKGSKATKKPYFIYLFDNDCDDCLRVEQMTLSDAAVSNAINENLLVSKIDINSQDGRKLKEKKKIKLAPAFLFYDKKGKLLLQQESAMSSDAMLKLLNVLYDLDVDLSTTENSKQQFENTKHMKVTVPRKLSSYDDASINQLNVISDHKIVLKKPRRSLRIKAAKIPLLSSAIISKAKENNLKSPDQLFDPNYVIKPDVYSLAPKQKNQKSISTPNVNQTYTKVLPSKAKLVNTAVVNKKIIYAPEKSTSRVSATVSTPYSSAKITKNKTIQFAAYTKYDDVLKGMYKMKRKIQTPLTILEEYTNGKLMYKLVSADQLTSSEADSQIKTLKQQGIDCFARKSPK